MKLSRFCPLIVAGFALAFPAIASAAPLNVVNPSFEDISGESPYNEFTFGPLNGWQLHDPTNVTNGGAGPAFWIGTLDPTPGTWFTSGAPDGDRVGIAFLYSNQYATGEFGLRQVLADTLAPNTTYTLQVDVGNIASGTGIDNQYFNLNGFPGYRIDFVAGGVVLDSDINTLSIAEGEWGTSTVTYTTGVTHAQLGQALEIRLVNLNVIDPGAPTADIEVDFDNVRLNATPAIPEPTSALLLIPAAALLISRRQRSSSGASR